MDVLQVTYRSKMALFFDSPSTLVDGQWHQCPPGAVVYPGWHAFGSQIWDPEVMKDVEPAIGEQQGKLGFVQSFPTPGYSGQRWCGSASVWEHGDSIANQGSLPLDSRGRPVCCGAVDPGMVRVGGTGFQIGGTWFLRSDLPQPVPVLPGGILSSWSNSGQPASNVFQLSRVPGPTPDSRAVNIHGPLPCPAAESLAFLQFVSEPLAGLPTIPTQVRIAYGWTSGPELNNRLAAVAALVVVNGTDGSLRQDLTGLVTIGTESTPVVPLQWRIAEVTVPAAAIEPGDYLCLELGWHMHPLAGFGCQTAAGWAWEGTDVATFEGDLVGSPMALISYGADEDLDVPIPGSVIPFAGAAVPGGYLVCDGTAYPQASYPDLFAAIGTTWGSGGVGTFRVPDLRDRTVIGTSPGGLGPDRPTVRPMTTTGGEETHVLVTAELASHAHSIADPGHSHAVTDPGHSHTPSNGANFGTDGVAGGSNTVGAGGDEMVPSTTTDPTGVTVSPSATGITVNPNGGDAPHNNLQPFAVVQWLIKT